MNFNPINGIKKIFGLGQYQTVYVKSTVDNKDYLVRDLPDKQEAANLLAHVRIKLNNLKIHLESKFPDKPQIKQLINNFKADANRFYESLNSGSICLFDESCENTLGLCGYNIDKNQIIKNDLQSFYHVNRTYCNASPSGDVSKV